MARPSETEKEEQDAISCPQPCGKTLCIDGEIKCSRCKTSHVLEELIAERLCWGNVTTEQIFKKLAYYLWPYFTDEEHPYHQELRGLFSERFIGLPETIDIPMVKNCMAIFASPTFPGRLQGTLTSISMPYAKETLRRAAQDCNIRLVFMPDGWIARYALGGRVFCECHDEIDELAYAKRNPDAQSWLLIKIEENKDNIPSRYRDCDIEEATYFAYAAMSLGRDPFIGYKTSIHTSYRCAPWRVPLLTGESSEIPRLRYCDVTKKLYVSLRRGEKATHRILAMKPDR